MTLFMAWFLLALIVVRYVYVSLKKRDSLLLHAPTVGRTRAWEPKLILGLRFSRDSRRILREGYQGFKHAFFKIQRNDCEVTLIPPKHADELRNISDAQLSAMDAHLKNMVATYTIGNVALMRESDLHRRTIIKRLTPALGRLLPIMKEELELALAGDIISASADVWTSIKITSVSTRIVARIFARLFVGPELCRNPEWLEITVTYARSLSITRNLLRLLPSFLRPLAAPLIPSYWQLRAKLHAAEKLLRPLIAERRQEASTTRDGCNSFDDFLQWMIEVGQEHECSNMDLAQRQLLLGLASIHTTSLRISHSIYDICAYPEHLDELRGEMESAIGQDGGITKSTLAKLHKLDSFLKESQRMNPLLAMTFQRVVKGAIELKDGTSLPPGTHIAVAAEAMGYDQECLPGNGDPCVFDPFRYARLRADPNNASSSHRHQFAATSSYDLSFGHGTYACPGRFLASDQIKLMLVYMLLRYDYSFPEGQARPSSVCYDESLVLDPAREILIRERHVEGEIARVLGLHVV